MHFIPSTARRRRAVHKLEQSPDERQLALALDTRVVPTADLSSSEPEVAALVVTKSVARLALAKVTWAFNLVRPPSVLPLSLDAALEIECIATPEPPSTVAKADGPHVEYGVHTDDLHEYFITKGGAMNGVVHIKRKRDGTWGAAVSKTLLPYVLTSDAVSKGVMPPLGKSALPTSLERVVPRKYRYWSYKTAPEAQAVRNALVEAALFEERLIKVVDGDLRLCVEQLYLYEPTDDELNKADDTPLTLRTVLPLVVPTDMLKRALRTPLAEEGDWREALKNDDAEFLVLSAPTMEQLDEVVDELAKGLCSKPWVVEYTDSPETRVSMGVLGRVFKIGTPDAADRIFVASFPLANDLPSVRYCDVPLEKATWTTSYVNDLPDSSFLYVEGGGSKDEDGKTTPRSLRHFPYKDKDGKVDLPHLRNAAARIPQASISADKKDSLQAHARQLLADAQKAAKANPDGHNQYRGGGGGGDVRTASDAKVSAAANRRGSIADSKGGGANHMAAAAMHTAAAHRARLSGNKTAEAHHTSEAARHSAAVNKADTLDVEELCKAADTIRASLLVERPQAIIKPFAGFDSFDACLEAQAKAGHDDESAHNICGALQRDYEKSAAVAAELSKREVRIALAKDAYKGDLRYVLGIVLEPDTVDAQQDIYDADEIRKTAHEFMEKYRTIGLMHKGGVNDKVKILESYLAPCDFEVNGQPVKAGTWMMAVKVLDDELWGACKKGELTGFSIGGSAVRKPDPEATKSMSQKARKREPAPSASDGPPALSLAERVHKLLKDQEQYAADDLDWVLNVPWEVREQADGKPQYVAQVPDGEGPWDVVLRKSRSILVKAPEENAGEAASEGVRSAAEAAAGLFEGHAGKPEHGEHGGKPHGAGHGKGKEDHRTKAAQRASQRAGAVSGKTHAADDKAIESDSKHARERAAAAHEKAAEAHDKAAEAHEHASNKEGAAKHKAAAAGHREQAEGHKAAAAAAKKPEKKPAKESKPAGDHGGGGGHPDERQRDDHGRFA